MLEKNLQQKMMQICKRHAILAVKVDSSSSRGWPDLTMLLPTGEVLFVEVKTPTGRLSELQKHMLGKIEQNKGKAHVINSLEGFRALLRRSGVDA